MKDLGRLFEWIVGESIYIATMASDVTGLIRVRDALASKRSDETTRSSALFLHYHSS